MVGDHDHYALRVPRRRAAVANVLNFPLQTEGSLLEGNTLVPDGDAGILSAHFPDEMAVGGFEAVVGNPPWGSEIDYDLDPALELAAGAYDSYELFVERAIRDATRPGGLFGFIIPDRILRPEGERLRRWLFDNYQVLELIKLGEGVFPGVFRAAAILIVRKAAPGHDDQVRTLVVSKPDRAILEEAGFAHLRGLLADRGGVISRSRIVEDHHYDVPLGATDEDLEIVEAMREGALTWIGSDGVFQPYGRGVELGTDGFIIRCNACFAWQVGPQRRAQARGGGYYDKTCENCDATIAQGEWEDSANIIVDEPPEGSAEDRRLPGAGWHPIYFGEHVSRYELSDPKWIKLGVPNISYKDAVLYAPPKLLVRQAGVGVNAAVDESDAMCLQSVYVYRVRDGLEIDPYYVLGCLASRAMLFYFHRITNQTEWQSFPKLVHTTLQRLAVPSYDRVGRALHDEIAPKARQRMGLQPEDARELDLELENLVMDAYRLTPSQRQRIVRTLRSVQRLRVIREMFPADDGAEPG